MGAIVSIEIAVFLDHLRRFDEPHIDRALVVATAVAFAITSQRRGGPHECCVDFGVIGHRERATAVWSSLGGRLLRGYDIVRRGS